MGAAGLAGAAAGLALLVRPNLILLAGAFALWICWQDWRVGRGVMRLRRVAAFGICVAVSAAVVARVNLTLFGSATSSGYGDLSVLFALFWVPANIRLYGAWVIESQTPLVLVGVAMALLPVRRVWKTAPAQRGASLLGLLVVTVLSSYFVYQPFDAWWYLRYLLPAWPAVFLGVGILVARAMETRRLVPAALALLAVGWLSTQGVMYAERHDAFTMRDNEIRYQAVAALVHANTDPSSIILSMQHSGSVRYYAGRNTLRYDLLDPAWLDPAVEWLRAHGAHPYLLVDDWECQRFRDRFSPANRLGSLTLTPTLVYEAATTSALYDLDAASGVAPTPRVVSHLSLPPGGAPPLPPPVLKFAR
jgi:hypothetical protein